MLNKNYTGIPNSREGLAVQLRQLADILDHDFVLNLKVEENLTSPVVLVTLVDDYSVDMVVTEFNKAKELQASNLKMGVKDSVISSENTNLTLTFTRGGFNTPDRIGGDPQ